MYYLLCPVANFLLLSRQTQNAFTIKPISLHSVKFIICLIPASVGSPSSTIKIKYEQKCVYSEVSKKKVRQPTLNPMERFLSTVPRPLTRSFVPFSLCDHVKSTFSRFPLFVYVVVYIILPDFQ